MTETTQPPKEGGKGRPTPKRSERVKARRKPVVAPSSREAVKAQRSAAAEKRRLQKEAMRTGDERNYPPIAAGPERAAVRDLVDARRPYWQMALPLYALGLGLSLAPSNAAKAIGTLTLPFVFAMLLVDLVGTRRAVRKGLEERFPNGTREPVRSLVWYGVARNMQFRRSRLPRPRTSPGGRPAGR